MTLRSVEKMESVEEMERNYPDMTYQVKEKIEPNLSTKRIIVCKMKVKGGKRKIVEYLTQRSKNGTETIKNIFLSSWNRKADNSQREELKEYGVEVVIPSTKSKRDSIIRRMETCTSKARIHLDELDYGCGNDSLLSDIYNQFKDNNKLTWILYSATPEEIICSEQWEDIEEKGHGIFVEIDPPSNYVGIKQYIDKNLMKQAFSMFDFDKRCLTQHGKEVISDAFSKYVQDNNKNICIVRVTGKHNKTSRYDWVKKNSDIIDNYIRETFQQPGNNVTYIFRLKDIGSKSANSIKWEDYAEWEEKSTTCFFIYLLEQTACRATELKCHHRLNFYHTYKYTPEANINSIIQDQERPAYYKLESEHPLTSKYPKYRELDPYCTIYGDFDVASYSAGYITLEDLLMKRNDLCPSIRTVVLRNYNDKIKPLTISGSTYEDLLSKIREIEQKHGNVFKLSNTFDVNKPNRQGFIESTIRSIKKVYSFNEIEKTNYGISKSVVWSGRRYACYKETNDVTSLVFVAIINTGERHDNEITTKCPSSMYSN